MRTPSCLCSANWPLLIGICIIMPPLLTRYVVAITNAKANIASGTAAVTNYHNNRNYEDAATAAAAAAAVTAAMTAAATAKDYSQQLPRYYQAPTAVAARDVGGADMAATSIYRNYFENSSVGSDKNGATTVITPDAMAQWRSAAGKRHAAMATDEAAMTAAGFVPTTMTAAGQHYVTSLNAAVSDFPANEGEKAGREERDANADGVGSYAYAAPEGKIDYEINEDNYANGDAGVGGDGVGAGVGDGVKLRANDAYEMYRYDMGEYAEHMQQALAAGAANMEGQQYEATADVDSSNQGGGSYFEERLPGYENYLVPTYQIEQFSNYHNQEEQQGPHGQEALQVAQQPKSDGQEHEHGREQPQLRPMALFDSSDDVDKAVLQQFNKVANIGNYENDKRKLRYYTEQPQLQQEQQQQQQQQQLEAQYQHQHQQQKLQLSHQLRKIPDFMHFSLHQHLPRLQQHPATAMRPIDKVPLSGLRRQQQQLRHHRRDTTYLPSLQVIGNAGRLSLLPTSKNLHIGSDISSSGSNHNNGEPNNGSIHSRSRNDKRSIRENVDDTSNAPSLYHYALTQAHANFYPRHVSRLVDDSVNEIDDTHNNIDDNGSDNGSDSSNDGTNRRGHQNPHHHHPNHLHHDYASVSHHQPSAPYHQQVGTSNYALPPITSTVRHTPASSAALAGVPLARHIEVTKHIPTIANYERIQVPYNQTIPIPIPKPIVTAIPRPYAIRVPVTKTVAVPKVQEVRIPVEKVKPFPVERPVPFVVERRFPFMVEKQVAKPVYYPYPVQVPIVKTIVHKVPRRQHSYATYQPHANSYSLPLSQYHVQHQHSGTHALPALHYTQAGHLG